MTGHFISAPKLMVSGAVNQLPPYAFIACTGTTLILPYSISLDTEQFRESSAKRQENKMF